MGGTCGMHGREANAYRSLVGSPEGSDLVENLGVNRLILLK
jgi:hypothetical protein